MSAILSKANQYVSLKTSFNLFSEVVTVWERNVMLLRFQLPFKHQKGIEIIITIPFSLICQAWSILLVIEIVKSDVN